MKWTLFFSRLAWILNACFLITLLLRVRDISSIPADLTGTLVVAGWILAPFVNALVFVLAIIYRRRTPPILLHRYYAVYLVVLLFQLLFITRLI